MFGETLARHVHLGALRVSHDPTLKKIDVQGFVGLAEPCLLKQGSSTPQWGQVQTSTTWILKSLNQNLSIGSETPFLYRRGDQLAPVKGLLGTFPHPSSNLITVSSSGCKVSILHFAERDPEHHTQCANKWPEMRSWFEYHRLWVSALQQRRQNDPLWYIGLHTFTT